MTLRNAKYPTAILAAAAGLLFALVYVGLEFLHEVPQGISLDGAANTISVWHFPLIWLLAAVLSYCVLYAVGTIRAGKVKERAIRFAFSVAGAVLLTLVWLLPMLAGLIQSFGENGG